MGAVQLGVGGPHPAVTAGKGGHPGAYLGNGGKKRRPIAVALARFQLFARPYAAYLGYARQGPFLGRRGRSRKLVR
jgi:hypothetical protein